MSEREGLMSSRQLEYKGCLIIADPKLIREKMWYDDFFIQRIAGKDFQSQKYPGNRAFKTEEEAIESCFERGKIVIDATVEK
jgi:hypothetical protein